MRRIGESSGNFRLKPRHAALGAALMAVACSNSSSSSAGTNPELPPGTCASGAAISPFYPGDTSLGVKADDQRTWKYGMVAQYVGTLPQGTGYRGTELGWRSPDGPWHWSDPVAGPEGQNLIAKIGPGVVGFAVRVVMTDNDTAVPKECATTPKINFCPDSPNQALVATLLERFAPADLPKFEQ